jgi:GMP synthase PP-ATPase subunit
MISCHAFPSLGLTVREPGDITREKLDILRNTDAMYLGEIEGRPPDE